MKSIACIPRNSSNFKFKLPQQRLNQDMQKETKTCEKYDLFKLRFVVDNKCLFDGVCSMQLGITLYILGLLQSQSNRDSKNKIYFKTSSFIFFLCPEFKN